MSTTRLSRGVWSQKHPTNEAGEKLCFNCRGLLPKGKRFNCSAKCSEEWRIKTSTSHVRWLLRQRDKGICVLCGAKGVWEADHITPVIEGGGECGIENYRTLCIPCHRKVTRELRARLAETRRAEKIRAAEAILAKPLLFGDREPLKAAQYLRKVSPSEPFQT